MLLIMLGSFIPTASYPLKASTLGKGRDRPLFSSSKAASKAGNVHTSFRFDLNALHSTYVLSSSS